jgi:hypothetical protein
MEHFAGIERVVGTQQRGRGGWRRQDRARGKGGERAGGPGPVLPRAGDWGDADGVGSGVSVAMAAMPVWSRLGSRWCCSRRGT